jgi:hypothetical protein
MIFDLPGQSLQNGSQQLDISHSSMKINFWNFIFRAQFGPPPRAVDLDRISVAAA